MSRRRRWAVVAGVALLLVLGVGAAAARSLNRVSDDLKEAQGHVEQASSALEDGRLGDARTSLVQARQLLLSANNGLYNAPQLEFISWLPVVKQNLESLRGSVALAFVVVNGGDNILQASTPLQSADGRLEVSLSDGSIPLEAVRDAGVQASDLSAQLPAAVPRSGATYLLAQTKELRTSVYGEAVQRRAQLDVLSRGLGLLSHLAGGDGPRRYLLAVANTAEMRGSGGMILNFGVLEGNDGVIDLTRFGRIDELALAAPVDAAAAQLPLDYLARWSGFEPTLLWRNATMAGDFTLVAPVLEAMYEQSSGAPVDGVIQVDAQGLAAILTAVGPVEVPEVGLVSAENVVSLVLNDAYRLFPGLEERSDVLGDVAQAAFRRLVDGQFPSLRPLADALVTAVDGRHLLFHSESSSANAAGSFFGAAGDLPPVDTLDSAHLTVQNVAGNKLDYYLDTELRLSGERRVGQLGSLQAEIVLANTAPPGEDEPEYIFGPFNRDQKAGLYRGIVTLYLPAGSTLVGSDGDPVRNPPVAQTEGGRPLVSYTVDVPAGETRRLVLDLRMAPLAGGRPYELTVVPSPRVRPTRAVVGIETDGGTVTGDVSLTASTRFAPGRRPSPAGDR